MKNKSQLGFGKTLIIIAVVVILIVVAGAAYWFGRDAGLQNSGQETAKPENTKEFDRAPQPDAPYVSDDFTFIPPSGWIQTQIPSTLVSYQNAKEKQVAGSAAAKINFKSYMAVSFDGTNGQSLAQIAELVKNQTKGVAPAISFDPVVDGIIGGQPAKVLEASLLMQDVNFRVILAVAMKGDKYFTISFNTTADKWAEYRDIFYNALNSFKFKY